MQQITWIVTENSGCENKQYSHPRIEPTGSQIPGQIHHASPPIKYPTFGADLFLKHDFDQKVLPIRTFYWLHVGSPKKFFWP